jgi:hypothetical protein
MIAVSVSIIWLLAMLAAAAHLQDSARNARNGLAAAAAFMVIVLPAVWLSPQPNWIGVLLGIGASWRLIVGPLPRFGSALAGASAALAAALQIAGGVSPWLALSVTAAGLAVAFLWRGGLVANGSLREVVLVLDAFGLPLAGLTGDLLFGWASASMLNVGAAHPVAPEPPLWALAIVGAAILAGLIRGAWIKR